MTGDDDTLTNERARHARSRAELDAARRELRDLASAVQDLVLSKLSEPNWGGLDPGLLSRVLDLTRRIRSS